MFDTSFRRTVETGLFGGGKNLTEVKFLTIVGDINYNIGLQLIHTIVQSGQIRGVVSVPTTSLHN